MMTGNTPPNCGPAFFASPRVFHGVTRYVPSIQFYGNEPIHNEKEVMDYGEAVEAAYAWSKKL